MDFKELGQLPRLNPEVGRIIAEHMTKLEQFQFGRALQRFTKDGPNLASVKSLGISRNNDGSFRHLKIEDVVESEALFREHRDKQNPQLEGIPEKLIVTKAPIEVVRLYEEVKRIPDGLVYNYNRHDIILAHGKELIGVRARISPELSAVAIDSIYRSLPDDLADTFAEYIAEAARLDAMKYITAMGRRPLAITVSDIGASSIPAMAWARKNGKEWRLQSTMRDDMYQSLEIVQWLDNNGYPWGYVDWWGIFGLPPNTRVVEYLIDKIPISDHAPDHVDPAFHEWRDRQHSRWRKQLLSLETLEEAPIHEYPDNILYKAPPEVIRAHFNRLGQEAPLYEYFEHSRYDMHEVDFEFAQIFAQMPAQYVINIRTTEHMADTTLIGIYRATEGKNRYPFVCTLMREGRLAVLRNIDIPYSVKIFDANFTDPTTLNIPNSVIQWARTKDYEWGTLHHPADPLLMKLYRSLGAPV